MIRILSALWILCSAAASTSAAQDAPLKPPGMQLPYRAEPACPGEGCAFGTWLACDSVPLYERPQDAVAERSYLHAGDSFEVTTGAVIVERPEVVVVTRPTRRISFLPDAGTLEPGDTLYVLDYLGEGFFNAWQADSLLEVGIFWPRPGFFNPPADFEYGGEVVQPGVSSFWVQAVADDGRSGWIRVDSASVAARNSLDPDPPACR